MGALSAATLAYVALASTVVSTGVAVYSSQQAAKTAERAGKYNAALARSEALARDMEARENIRRGRLAGQKFLGRQRANMAKGGALLSAGSPIDQLAFQAGEIELQAQDAARAAEARRRAGFAAANVAEINAANTATGYRNQATASLISGVGRAAGAAYGYYDAGAFG